MLLFEIQNHFGGSEERYVYLQTSEKVAHRAVSEREERVEVSELVNG